MGKAHSNAWRQAPRFFDLPADVTTEHALRPRCARGEKAANEFWLGEDRDRLARGG